MGFGLPTLFGFDPLHVGGKVPTVGGFDPLGVNGGKGKSSGNLADQYGADAISQLDKLYPEFRQSYNSVGGAPALGGRSYEQWLTDHFKAYPGNDDVQAAMQSLNQYQQTGQMMSQNQAPGLEPVYADGSSSTGDVPIEQGIFDMAKPGLIDDVAQDANRRKLATSLGVDAQNNYRTAQGTLQEALGPTFDAETYFRQNPDVAAAYAQSDHSLSPTEFAQQHYEQYGKNEGRQGAFNTLLTREYGNAADTAAALKANAQTSATSQLQALQSYAANAKNNLSGELQARAAALEKMIADLNSNLNTYTQSQKDALAQQIKDAGLNLETSINSQKDALTTELASLQGAADTESVSRKAALADEVQKLTAAQAPVAAARTQAAESAATAVNLGLESQKDQMTADQALQGYVGGSSMGDAAVARASIDARQKAAQIMGDANTANATDMRDVNVHGATEGRSIADSLAGQTKAISQQGAADTRTLATALATGKQQIGDYNASETRGITSNDATQKAQIGQQGATQTYNDTTYGAGEGRKIGDALNSGTLNVNTTLAQQIQDAGNKEATAKSAYFDNNYQRQLAAALTAPQLTTNLTNTLTGLDNYGNTGLNRTLNTLNWWSTSGQAPTPSNIAATADQSGNSLSQLGAGLFGAATNIAQKNNWWQTPTVSPSGTSKSVNYGQYPTYNGTGTSQLILGSGNYTTDPTYVALS